MAIKPPADDLIARIDNTALTLLQRIGGGGINTAEQSAILTEQVKAFDAIVKWASVRKDLLPKEEPKATKFGAMKSAFHDVGSGAAAGNRRGAGKAAHGKDSALPAFAAPADADGGDADGGDADDTDD
jgi:hypothetical protein